MEEFGLLGHSWDCIPRDMGLDLEAKSIYSYLRVHTKSHVFN